VPFPPSVWVGQLLDTGRGTLRAGEVKRWDHADGQHVDSRRWTGITCGAGSGPDHIFPQGSTTTPYGRYNCQSRRLIHLCARARPLSPEYPKVPSPAIVQIFPFLSTIRMRPLRVSEMYDGAGNLYFADSGSDVIRRIDAGAV